MMVPPAGFWGVPSSSVDWCEINYERSRFVCEWFNTTSSVAMLIAGGLGVWLHRRVLEVRFLLAFAVVAVVGLGSAAFHATLWFELQMLDEIPMLYSALVMVYIFLENRIEPRFGRWFPFALVAHGFLVTALTALTHGKLQFYLFHASFDSMEFFALYRVYRIYRASKERALRALYVFGMLAYAAAMLCWIVDFKACDAMRGLVVHGIPNPQLHAFWHVFVSIGLYLLTLVVAYDRLQTLHRSPDVVFLRGVLPWLRAAQPS
jgi:dihydroceramidase